MPLTKEQMRVYQRNRRAQQRERGGIEGVKRANTLIKVDAIGSDKCQINHSIEENLPVPLLAEPPEAKRNSGAESPGSSSNLPTGGEARESITEHKAGVATAEAAPDSSGGQNFMTSTDQKFYMKKPGYYIFEKEIQLNKDGSPRVCWYCKTRFDTRLSMNKFCCPEHKEAWLVASLRRGE